MLKLKSSTLRVLKVLLTVTLMTSALTVSAQLPSTTAGTYQALLDHHAWYNGGYGGSLRITVTTTGSYSGTITRGIHENTIKGKFTQATVEAVPQSTFFVPRRYPYAPLFVTLQIPSGENTITGTLLEPSGEILSISGRKAGFNSKLPATGFVGTWNTAYEIPVVHIGNASLPQGACWARQKISSSGVATWIGRLPDGNSFTHSSLLSASGHAALHVMLHGYRASIQGWQVLNAESKTSIATLYWIKSAFSKTKYPDGFPMLTLLGNGGKYTAPTGSNLIFGITSGQQNARFAFSQGGLASSFSQPFTMGAKHKITLPTGSGNPYQIKATLDPATGILLGSGKAINYVSTNPSSGRPGTFSAVAIPGRDVAVGNFQLPVSTAKGAQILSGKLVAEENYLLNY